METLGVSIPMYRRMALAGGQGLPEQAIDAALFADISGFTPLAQVLTDQFGRRRAQKNSPTNSIAHTKPSLPGHAFTVAGGCLAAKPANPRQSEQ
jgi:hypothetical protein